MYVCISMHKVFYSQLQLMFKAASNITTIFYCNKMLYPDKECVLNYHVHLTTFLFGSDHKNRYESKHHKNKCSCLRTEINLVLGKNGGHNLPSNLGSR